jgi:N-acetylglutamate synthase-like GNAT family acetyltransferase
MRYNSSASGNVRHRPDERPGCWIPAEGGGRQLPVRPAARAHAPRLGNGLFRYIPSMAFSIQPHSPGRTEEVIAHIVGIQREFGIQITAAEQPDLRDVAAFYQRGGGGFWLAIADGAVIGTIALKVASPGKVALRKMFVARPWRGREFGVGAGLLAAALRHCEQNGIGDIYLGTTEDFKAAHRFYEKNGFVRIQKAELPAGFPMVAVDTVFYWCHRAP